MKNLVALSLLAVGASAARLDLSLRNAEPTDIIIELPAPVDVASFGNLDALSAAERRTLVGHTLMQATQASQENVVELLKAYEADFEQFWITNTILVKNADKDLIAALLTHDDVEEIRMDREIARIDAPFVHSIHNTTEAFDASPMWNLKQINVPEAWAITQGEGVVVANIDTGVRYTHTAIKSAYRGYNSASNTYTHDYNWWDPKKSQTVPTDGAGHGSHTMGSIVGSESSGFGVAPAARWIASKGCGLLTCSESRLTSSAQFVLCPTKLDGTGADCSKGANVVSNSWGGGRGNSWYSTYVNAWRAAGIIPVFSAGNSGPSCSTANSPADMNTVISVGSTGETRALSSFSSRGPGINSGIFPLQKPDISAPGEKVVSVSYSSDSGTATMSGTSMSGPHIAGVVALIMSAYKNKNGRFPTYDEVFNILITTAQTSLSTPSGSVTTCSNVRFDAVPNYFYGWGIVDAQKAVKAASA